MGKKFEEDQEEQIHFDSEEEVAADSGFDLRGKSLKNTQRKTEEKKAVLPLQSIMNQILDKPASTSTLGVGLN